AGGQAHVADAAVAGRVVGGGDGDGVGLEVRREAVDLGIHVLDQHGGRVVLEDRQLIGAPGPEVAVGVAAGDLHGVRAGERGVKDQPLGRVVGGLRADAAEVVVAADQHVSVRVVHDQ